jgi:hypothetical protein
MASSRVLRERTKWYQVVLSVGRSEVRERVQAVGVDAAVRAVMRSHGLAVADSASIWLLGRSGAPSLRSGVRCRLPRVSSRAVVS